MAVTRENISIPASAKAIEEQVIKAARSAKQPENDKKERQSLDTLHKERMMKSLHPPDCNIKAKTSTVVLGNV